MSEEVEHNFVRDSEQITKTPVQDMVKKEKDPKKVAAGKKLAEYNKRAKEALKEKMKRDAEKVNEEEREMGESKPWIPELSFTTVISLVGIGLTAFDLFIRFNRKDNKPDTPPPPRLPEPPSELLRPSKIPVPKMGMI